MSGSGSALTDFLAFALGPAFVVARRFWNNSFTDLNIRKIWGRFQDYSDPVIDQLTCELYSLYVFLSCEDKLCGERETG